MKIQIASDLHLEFPENLKWINKNPLQNKGDILLLAGDIILDKYRKKAEKFYNDISRNFKYIISTMGNHEFYHGEVKYAYPDYKKMISENHYKLNNKSIIIDNIKIISSVLWSYIPDNRKTYIYSVMNDYRLIYKKEFDEKVCILIDETNYFHLLSKKFIEKELKKDFNGKIIILTHHLPSYDLIKTRYENTEFLKYAFASDLMNIIENYKIDLWVFGHIHESVDTVIHNTRFLCNPLGYMKEKQKKYFKNDLIIDI